MDMGFGGGRGGFDDPYDGGPSPTVSMFGLEEKVPITKKPPLQVRFRVRSRAFAIGCVCSRAYWA